MSRHAKGHLLGGGPFAFYPNKLPASSFNTSLLITESTFDSNAAGDGGGPQRDSCLPFERNSTVACLVGGFCVTENVFSLREKQKQWVVRFSKSKNPHTLKNHFVVVRCLNRCYFKNHLYP